MDAWKASNLPQDPDAALRDLLDGELDELPEKYRRPLILFHFEGRSLEDTARELGSPTGTVGAWLSRGRDLLRDRLARRGAGALSGALLGAFLAREARSQSAGWGFARGVARAAAGGAVSPPVVGLVHGGLKMMLIPKIKAAAVALIAAGSFLSISSLVPTPAPGATTPPRAASPAETSLAPAALELPQSVLSFEPFERMESPFPPTADLVGHWKLDDEKGSATAADATGKANGRVVGGAAFSDGKIGGALKCDGTGGYVEIPSTEELDKVQEDSYTLAAWFRPEGVPPGTESANNANYGIILKTGWHVGLYYTNEKKFTMAHWLAGDKPEEPVWTGTGAWDEEYEPGQWYHVVGTVDRAAGKITIYLNGEAKNSAEFTANAPFRKYEKMTWKIGIGSPGAKEWSWPAKGSIDDVRIYNRALSAAEVKDLYAGK
jgi:hypothetical protein